uniref:Uncharacterized protein n=1 Tax=Arundo donax TaxID=35708 RepID=A0A0A8ZXC7_ARUDO
MLPQPLSSLGEGDEVDERTHIDFIRAS